MEEESMACHITVTGGELEQAEINAYSSPFPTHLHDNRFSDEWHQSTREMLRCPNEASWLQPSFHGRVSQMQQCSLGIILPRQSQQHTILQFSVLNMLR